MLDGGNNWNQNLVQALFSPQISSLILNTPILDLEQERLVWTPSLTWSFSVKTSHNLIIKSRLNSLQGQDINWKLIWGARQHGRHALLLWKMLTNTLSTLEILQQYSFLKETNCYFCSQDQETIHHLLLCCPITKLLWWNSEWNLRVENFQHLKISEWIMQFIEDKSTLPVDKGTKHKMLNFLTTMMEQVWMIRNKVWKGGNMP